MAGVEGSQPHPEAAPSRRKCFVVGPIGAPESTSRTHADWLMDGIIKPVFGQHFHDFDLIRSDRISQPGLIDVQMINHLLEDDLVIADLSELNPNAFYEIGIRHMAQKPIIHVFLDGTEIPFDIKLYRAIPFGITKITQVEAAKAALKTAVEETLDPSYIVENPITRTRGLLDIEKRATPETRITMERLDRLEALISSMSSRVQPVSRQLFFIRASNPVAIDDQIAFSDAIVRRYRFNMGVINVVFDSEAAFRFILDKRLTAEEYELFCRSLSLSGIQGFSEQVPM